MMFVNIGIVCAVILFAAEFSEGSRKCIVVAPRSLRSNSNYTISVATTGSKKPTKFKIKIFEREAPIANRTLEFVRNAKNLQIDPHDFVTLVGPEAETADLRFADVRSTDDKAMITFVRTRTVEVEPDNPRLVTFKIDNDVEPGSYLLDVQSLSGPPFHERKFLYVESKTATIHIQTDKAIYKPGEQVEYRLLVVDADTKPIDIEHSLEVSIFDPAHNLVGQMVSQSAPYGVYMGTFDIGEHGSLGIWQIDARYKTTKLRKSLECAYYQLPRFQVAVNAPTVISKSDKYLTAAIKAFYLFGKPVNGEVMVKATPIQNRADFWKENAEPIVVKDKIFGKFIVKFPLNGFGRKPITAILLETEVHESATGLYQRAFDRTILVQPHDDDHMAPSSLQIKIVGAPQLNSPIKVHVKSTEKLESVFYYVIGRGNVLLSESVDFDGKQHGTIIFNTSFSMAPQSSLVVFYIDHHGKIVSAGTALIFDDCDLPSPVKVSVNNNCLMPNERLTIHVASEPESYVSFTLIDQSLLLLRKGNDLSIKDVYNELELYDNSGESCILSDAVNARNLTIPRRPFEVDYRLDILDPVIVPWIKKVHKYSKHKESRASFQENFWNGSQIRDNPLEFDIQIPDSMTSWLINGISLNPETGLGVLMHPIVVSTFKPFFVDVILPSEAAERHEKVTFQVVVHNYLHWNAKIFVKLNCEGQDVEIIGENYKHLRVAANRVRATTFTVILRELGAQSISVTAYSRHTFDNVVRVLNVIPEGVTIERYITKDFVLNATQNFDAAIDLQIPDTAISHSVKGQIAIQGDKYTLDLKNLENFDTAAPGFGLNLPFGVAAAAANEQQFASINQLSCGTREKTEATIAKAEKTIARYQCADGGFNPEGDCTDPDRDTFFTAQNMVVLLSNNAKYLKNPEVLGKTLDYLARIQREDGSFPETSANPVPRPFKEGVGLTSYVMFMLVFNEINRYVPKSYASTVAKSIDYLLHRLHELDDGSLIYLATYTVVLNHPAKNQVLAMLESKIYRSRNSAWFENRIRTDETIESYAFGLITVLLNGNFVDGLRLSNGLARSLVATFDGSANLKAILSRAALAIGNQLLSLAKQTINISWGLSGSHEQQSVRIDNSNRAVLQKFELPSKNLSSIDVKAQGDGYASFQIKYQYNLPEHEIHNVFQVQTHLEATGNDKWNLQVCTKFLGCDEQTTSDAQLEITLPVGCDTDEFIRDADPLSAKILRKRFRNNDLVVEFKDLNEHAECFIVPIYRKVSYTVQPRVGSVLVFDQNQINYRTKTPFEV